jgi:hypothetical protein
LVFSVGAVTVAFADVPQQINHQGVVSVNGTPFNGTGSFKFAIYDRGTGVNLWCNDDNDPANTPVDCTGAVGADPDTPVSIAVSNGVYTVRLGDTGLANMTPLPSSVFNNSNTALRIWFDDGVNGSQQLTPDHVLTPSPYAHQAAFMPPVGSIIAWHKSADGVPTQLPDGWVECNGQFATDDPTTPVDERDVPNLNSASGYDGGKFLRGNSVSGVNQDASFHYSEGGGAWLFDLSEGVKAMPGQTVEKITSLVANAISFTGNSSAPINREYKAARPVNMSVVWIMRVK